MRCKQLWSILFIITFVAVLSVFSGASQPLANNDEGIWHYMGFTWAEHGVPPYHGTVDNKPPGMSLLYALSYKTFGISFVPVRVAGLFCCVIATLALFVTSGMLFNRRAAYFTAIIFGATQAWQSVDGWFLSCTENFLIACTSLTAIVFAHPFFRYHRSLGAVSIGLLLGVALSFKQSAAFSVLAASIIFLIASRKSFASARACILRISVAGVVCICTVALFLLPLYLSGVTLAEYGECVWSLLIEPGTSSAPDIRWRLDSFVRTWTGPLQIYYILFLAVPATTLWSAAAGSEKYLVLRSLVIWLVVEFLAVNSSGVTHPHQVRQLLPPLALIAGAVIDDLMRERRFRGPAVALVAALIPYSVWAGFVELYRQSAVFVPDDSLVNALHQTLPGPQLDLARGFGPWRYHERDFFLSLVPEKMSAGVVSKGGRLGFYTDNPAIVALGAKIAAFSLPADKVFVFARGDAALAMLYSHRVSSTRFFSNTFLYGFRVTESPAYLAELRASLDTLPPALIVTKDDMSQDPPFKIPTWLTRHLSEKYTLLQNFAGFSIYRNNLMARRDLP